MIKSKLKYGVDFINLDMLKNGIEFAIKGDFAGFGFLQIILQLYFHWA